MRSERREDGVMQTRRTMLIGAIAVAILVAILVAGSAYVAGANGRETGLANGPTPQAEGAESCPPADAKLSQTTQIATAKLIIEYTATDQDFGVHGGFD